VLLDNAARKLDVPVEELTTEPSVVVHAKSGRKLGYGDITPPLRIPEFDNHCRNASMRGGAGREAPGHRMPIRGMLPSC
jgi:hypothetical protein